nr:MAG TPA: hypothetical protein [Caudoviricetes sp.]
MAQLTTQVSHLHRLGIPHHFLLYVIICLTKTIGGI